jgi:hypothetical protein
MLAANLLLEKWLIRQNRRYILGVKSVARQLEFASNLQQFEKAVASIASKNGERKQPSTSG